MFQSSAFEIVSGHLIFKILRKLLLTNVRSLFCITRRRWEGNIKMDLREMGCDLGDWIDLAEDRDQWRAYVRAVMNLRVP